MKEKIHLIFYGDWHVIPTTRTNVVTKAIDYLNHCLILIFFSQHDNAYGSDYEAYLYVHSKPV